MPTEIIGSSTGDGMRFAIVVSRFNAAITDALLVGASATLREHEVADEDILVVRVPGAFELPPVAARLAQQRDSGGRPQFAAVICLGAVIRGETPHFDHVAARAATGIGRVADEAPGPVIFGVLTCDTVAQAEARAGLAAPPEARSGGKPVHSNKGAEAARAGLEMAGLLRVLGSGDAREIEHHAT